MLMKGHAGTGEVVKSRLGGVEVPDLADVEACRAREALLGQLGRGRCESRDGHVALRKRGSRSARYRMLTHHRVHSYGSADKHPRYSAMGQRVAMLAGGATWSG